MERKLKVLDLFAGIGGFALGLDSTGFFKTVKFVEKDKYCQKVLRKNFPNIPIEEDIKDVKGKRYEADVIVGGFPCQPMSVAGKRKGTNDDRYLWPEMFRLIREIKPEFVIGENVQGIINIQNGMVLRQVQDDLESEGFEVQCFLIPASGIGAWHQRYRVWIIGHSNDNGLLREVHKAEIVSNTHDPRRKDRSEKHRWQQTQSEERINSPSGSDTISKQHKKEDVSNTNHTRGGASKYGIEREGQKTNKRWEGQSQFKSSRHDENVSNTEIIRTRESRNTDQEKRNQSSGSTQSNSSSEDVSNTDSGLRGRGTTIGQSREDKVWRFYPEKEEQTRVNIRSETIGRNAVSREDVSDTEHEGLQRGQRNHKGEGRQILSPEQQNGDEIRGETGRIDGVQREERDVTDTNEQRAQVSTEREHTGIEMSGGSSQKTWWQTQSNLCGVPNGISYELDKDRSNRIKTLGNAIVPQIAREFGLAIKKVLADEDII